MGINPKVNDFCFRFGKDAKNQFSDEELDLEIHPSSSWILKATFDNRALDTDLDIEVTWEVVMRDFSTFGDLLEVFDTAPCYGFFDGLRCISSDYAPVCEVIWGT